MTSARNLLTASLNSDGVSQYIECGAPGTISTQVNVGRRCLDCAGRPFWPCCSPDLLEQERQIQTAVKELRREQPVQYRAV